MANTQKNLIYPHRTSLLQSPQCDVCNNTSTNFLSVSKHPYLGLVVCDVDTCKEQAKSWLEKTTIRNECLTNEFGPFVDVRRTNGQKESGWVIYGDAYKEKEDGPFWVSVKDKHHHSKCIRLDLLKSWN